MWYQPTAMKKTVVEEIEVEQFGGNWPPRSSCIDLGVGNSWTVEPWYGRINHTVDGRNAAPVGRRFILLKY